MSNKFLDNTGVSDLVNSIATNIANKYATKAIATQSANGLMSAADKTKLDNIIEVNNITIDSALSSTSTNPVQNKVVNSALAGKAASSHSHTKSQITDFPSSLPANGGNADTLDGLHASDFCNANSPRITGAIRVNPNTEANFSEGIRIANATNGYSDIVLGAEGDSGITSTGIYIGKTAANEFVISRGASGDSSNGSLRLDTSGNWNVNGSNQLIHTGNIGSQSVNYANGAGNADTVDGLHASDFMPINGEVRKYGLIRMNASDGIRVRHIDGNDTEFDGALYLNWNSPNAPIYMNGGNTAIHSGNIGSQSVNYANGAGNTNTIGGFADAYHLGTLDAGGNGHGLGWQLFCQHNLYGDSRFGIKVGDGSLGVRVDFATTANNAATACYIDQVLLVGTSSSCHYNTILDWANSRKIAWASIIAGDGYPSDGPSQNEALLRVESDYYNARKIVTWTRYWGGQPAVIMQRTIFNGVWLDEWKSVSG